MASHEDKLERLASGREQLLAPIGRDPPIEMLHTPKWRNRKTRLEMAIARRMLQAIRRGDHVHPLIELLYSVGFELDLWQRSRLLSSPSMKPHTPFHSLSPRHRLPLRLSGSMAMRSLGICQIPQTGSGESHLSSAGSAYSSAFKLQASRLSCWWFHFEDRTISFVPFGLMSEYFPLGQTLL